MRERFTSILLRVDRGDMGGDLGEEKTAQRLPIGRRQLRAELLEHGEGGLDDRLAAPGRAVRGVIGGADRIDGAGSS